MNARKILFATATIAVIIAYLAWQRYERRRMVADLGATDRQALFENTISSFRTLCLNLRRQGFEKYCGVQRDFLGLFPECDSGCKRLLAKVEPVPTR